MFITAEYRSVTGPQLRGGQRAAPPKTKSLLPQTPFTQAVLSRWWLFLLKIHSELGENQTELRDDFFCFFGDQQKTRKELDQFGAIFV